MCWVPDELWYKIFSFIPFLDRIQLRVISKRWKSLIDKLYNGTYYGYLTQDPAISLITYSEEMKRVHFYYKIRESVKFYRCIYLSKLIPKDKYIREDYKNDPLFLRLEEEMRIIVEQNKLINIKWI